MRYELLDSRNLQDIKAFLSVLMVCISKNRALTVLARKFNVPPIIHYLCLENGVMMIPKRRLLTLIFACLCFKKSLLIN